MNAMKCANGHFFDTDKYAVCPYCGAGPEPHAPPAEQKPPEKARRRLFKKHRSEIPESPAPAYPPDSAGWQTPFQDVPVVQAGYGNDAYDGDKTVAVMKTGGDPMISCPFCKKQNRATAKFCIYCGSGLYVPASSAPIPEPSDPSADRSREWLDAYTAQEPAAAAPEESEAPAPETPEADAAAQSLRDAVLESVDEDDDRTIGFYSLHRPEKVSGPDPVVGWLVCVRGAHWGESFPISAGRNSVGRSETNKIVLRKDHTVSREKHAWISFDSRNGTFSVQPGDSSGMTYLNGESVFESKKLSAEDKLEFGDGTYLLVPLCGDHFSWETYI